MEKNLDFAGPAHDELLRLIDERSTAFRAAIAAAPGLDAPVPSCPGWTLRDLAQHLGEGRRAWAATVAAGPAATGKLAPLGEATAPEEREALLGWLAESTELLLAELREAGPDRVCWGWWGKSQTPLTSRGVARRQVHEISVHTWDAQLAAGVSEPLPAELAVDCVEEFLSSMCTTTEAWPHEPATADYHAAEGRSWRNDLSAAGATLVPVPADATPTAAAHGSASDLALMFYGRFPLDDLKLDGDRRLFDHLIEWDPER
ncbi:maleylpyruvate isomerase family mycothiol-dependent enzyme [Kitasatospora griseola]|uniref:maleylpyruvate isomerase family mycothiol-dependent enzyme n=1 Tax=Kitasatospora griseola TaxID=2064 RepID=UPI0005C64AC0|nr:maleylpyruvate isomerase family mycothiol-dependent enzyme [Kitasatospora griseola]